MKCPCRYCEKRYVGCHAKCLDYQEWNSENERLKNKHKEDRYIDNLLKEEKLMHKIKYQRKKGI